MPMPMAMASPAPDSLVESDDADHPANLICTLCAKFYTLGWVPHRTARSMLRLLVAREQLD